MRYNGVEIEKIDTLIEQLWLGDPVAQLVAATLWDRGHQNIDRIRDAMDTHYNYDMFGRLVDSVEEGL